MARKEVLHQIWTILPVCAIFFVLGLSGGWMAPTLNQLKNSTTEELSLTPEECSWVASLHYVTRTVGPIISATLLERVGHRPLFITISFISLIAWIAVLTTRSVIVLYAVRLLFGLAIGMFETTSSIYVGENCSPKVRGRFNGVLVACLYAGILTGTILSSYLSYGNSALTQVVISFLMLPTLFLLKEPAHFLLMKGKTQDAEKTYFWLRNFQNTNTKLEFEEMKQNAREEKAKTSLTELFSSPEVYKTLRIVFLLNFLMYLTGFPAINSFVTIQFSNSKDLTANEFTIIFCAFQAVSCCVSSSVMDKFKRRTLWLSACILTALSHAGTAALYYIQEYRDVPDFEWLLFATVTSYSCVYGMLMFPLASAARGELLPLRVKSFGNCLAVAASSITGFLTSRIFLPITEAYGIQTNFVFYSVICLVTLLYVYFDLPETRGHSLVTIQKSFKKKEVPAEIVPTEYNKLME